jgi:hypothetical protein
MKNIIVLVALTMTSLAHAEVKVPAFLIGKWVQATRSSPADTILIQADLAIELEQIFQVGREGSAVPYPTVCTYKTIGLIDDVTEASEMEKDYYKKANKEAPTISIGYSVNKIELLGGSKSSLNCIEFLKQQTASIQEGGLHYTKSLTDMSDAVILDPWYSYIFTKH